MRNEVAGPHDYPHFVINVWGGRLSIPPEYRGTPIAKQFTSGRLGGKKIVEEARLKDNADGREAVLQMLHEADDVDVYYVRSPRHSRERIGRRELSLPNFVEKGLVR